MWHFRMAGGPRIGENEVPGFGAASLAGDMPEGANQSADLDLGCVRGEIIERDVFPLGDYQDMRRGPRGDVVKGEDMLVLVDFLAGNFTAQNAGEDIVAVVGHHSPPGLRSEVRPRALFVEAGGAVTGGRSHR